MVAERVEYCPMGHLVDQSSLQTSLSILAMVIHKQINLGSPPAKCRVKKASNGSQKQKDIADRKKKRAAQIQEVGSLVNASVGPRCRLKYLECWDRLQRETGVRLTVKTKGTCGGQNLVSDVGQYVPGRRRHQPGQLHDSSSGVHVTSPSSAQTNESAGVKAVHSRMEETGSSRLTSPFAMGSSVSHGEVYDEAQHEGTRPD